MVFTLKWGILATGGIAKTFSKDILADPSLRHVSDVKHEIVAIASSSSVDKAKKFAEEVGATSAVAYGSYEELVADKNVDIIYVATPHSHHYDNTKLALNAGKHVLCEKPFTINAKQLAHLIKIAREKKLFLMEAVWTRYFPLTLELQDLLFKKRVLGKLLRVSSDLAVPFNIPIGDVKHRIKNPELGGGALLDLGIYSLTWIFVVAFADPDNKKQPPKVSGSILFTKDTHVDEHTTVNLIFPESHVSAIATTSMTGLSEHDNICTIQGEKGYIKIDFPTYRPEGYTVYLYEDDIAKGNNKALKVERHEIPVIGGHGMAWEADEAARCLRDGKLESDGMPLDESLIITQAMDTVRELNGFEYPAALEAVDQY